MKPIIRASLIAAAISFLPFGAQSAGLGQYTVRSKLGEPLNVEIQINATQQELQSLAARIAPADAFQQGGVPYASFVPNVRVAVENRGDRSVLKLSSDVPVNEAVASLVVQLNWDDGRVSRTYNILLDPPDVEIRPPAPVEPTVVAQPPEPLPLPPPVESPPPAPSLSAETAPAQPQELDLGDEPTLIYSRTEPESGSATAQESVPFARPPAEPARAAPPPPPALPLPAPSYPEDAGGEYAVKRGDTLGSIANRRAPLDASIDQMMMALYRSNPTAFIDNNINRLKTGVILKMPSADDVRSISSTEARREVRLQTQEFNAWRTRLADQAANRPASPSEENSGRTRSIDTVSPVAGQDRDRVAISSGDSRQGGNAAQLRSLEEDLTAAKGAQKEALERVGELEKIVEAQEKLLAAREGASKPQPPVAVPPPALSPAPVAQTSPASEPPAPVPEPVVVESQVTQEPQSPEPVALAEEAPKESVPEETAPISIEPPYQEPYEDPLVEKLTDPQTLGGVALIIAILAVFLGVRSWRSKRANMGMYTLSQEGTSMFTEDATSIFGDNGGQNVDTSASSVIHTDFSQTGLSIDTNEGVDPVAEADVYMAYGRDSQAEEILNDALKIDPKRGAIYVKLLEIYAQRQDLGQFEATASALFSCTQGQGRDWEKAVQMGRRLDPSNPLYSGGSSEGGSEVSRLPGLEPSIEETTGLDMGTSTNPASSGPTLSDLDFGASPATIAPAVETDTDGQLNKTAVVRGAVDAAPAVQPTRPEAATPTDVDFQFEPAETTPKAPGSIDFDLGKAKPVSETGKQPISISATRAAGTASKAGRKSVLPKVANDLAGPLDFDLPVDDQNGSRDMSATVVLPSARGGNEYGDDVTMDLEKTSFDPNALDFDLDLDNPADAATASVSPARGGKAKGSQSSVPASSAVDAVDPEEVDTKLELALAYGDMGDTEGALGLLREVVAEGNAAQKAEAKALIAKLG